MRLSLHFPLVTVLLLHAAGAGAAEPAAELLSAINERLGYMEDVAYYKAYHQLAIEDPERERTVLAKARASAAAAGLEPDSAEAFFAAQMTAAKAVQYRVRADLLLATTSGAPRDLIRDIRPALLALGDEILKLLATHLHSGESFQALTSADMAAALDSPYLSDLDRQHLLHALQGVRLQQGLSPPGKD